MSTTPESGHVTNCNNMEIIISRINGFGPQYNPSLVLIQILSLQAHQLQVVNALKQIRIVAPSYIAAVNARQLTFEPISPLSTRILNAVKVCGASQKFIEDCRTIIRKIRGERATPKIVPTPGDTEVPTDNALKNISASQQSFANRIDFFDRLIQLHRR